MIFEGTLSVRTMSIIRMMQHISLDVVRINPRRMDEDYGRFAWGYDPDGNKVKLWEPN